jgi:hypothetical protein
MVNFSWLKKNEYVKYVAYLIFFLGMIVLLWLLLRPGVREQSNLQWEQRDANFWQFKGGKTRYWYEDAASYCQHLELGQHYDWRLPTLDELNQLRSLSAFERIDMAKLDGAIYWSSTPFSDKKQRYWVMSFLNEQSAAMTKHNYNSAVCVRSINKPLREQ